MDMVLYALLKKKINGVASGVKSHLVVGTDLVLTFNDGSQATISFPAPKDGVSVDKLEFNETTNELFYYLTDGTKESAGTIPVGKDGLSAYEVAKKNGFDGTEQEWLDSLAAQGGKIDIIRVNGEEIAINPDDKSVDIEIPEAPVQSISVNNEEIVPDENGNVNITIPEAPVQSISQDGTALEIDENGNVDIPAADVNKIEAVKVNNTALEIDENKSVNIDLQEYAKTEEVEEFVDEQLYTTTTVEGYYEKADSATEGALEVVADDVTVADGQINVSNVTPVLGDTVIAAGDYVIWVEAVENKEEIYARKSNVYSKSETDTKIAEAITGGEVDLTVYVKHEEVEVMTEEELLAKIGLTEEELEGIAQLISDTEIRIDKTYSSSKIYTELQKILTESKNYTLEEIAKKTGASYKIAAATADMISTEYIYLLANGDTYDMYIVEADGSEPVKIGTTDIDLSDYYTIEKIDNLYALKTAVGDLTTLLTTNKKNIVDAINESYSIVPKTYATKVEVGDISTMKTEDKTSIVNAINELSVADYNATKTYATKTEVGDLTALKTTDKTSIVKAINENFNAIYDANKEHATKTEIGDLTLLKTENKDSVVNAINEAWGVGDNAQKAANNLTQNLNNHNYLDNSDFKINQRGLTTYSSTTDAIFCMDRWLINPNMTVSYSDTGSVLLTQSADQKQHFRQYISDPKRFAGKTVTLSIGTTATEGDIRLAIYDSPSTMTEGTWKYADKNVFTVNIENGIRAVSIIPITLGSTIEIQWIKLEIGSVATIYSPPDYAEELLKIQTMTDDGYTRLITNNTMPIIVNSQMISNENLLDNPDFSINQRGLTEYEVASKTYTVDRWKTPNVPSLIIPGDKQITIQRHSAATSKYSGLGQVVEKLVKGVYTFSIDIVSADTTVPSITMRVLDWNDITNNVSGTYYGIKSITNSTDIAGRYSLTFELPEDKENVYIYVYASNLEATDAKFTIANAKLEAGKAATPFVAPHPATELVKCQRYYQRLNTKRERMWSYNTNQLTFFLEYPEMLRPTATIVGTPVISHLNGSIQDDFTFSIGWCDYTGLRIDAAKTAHGMTDGVLTINSSSGSYIELSADL